MEDLPSKEMINQRSNSSTEFSVLGVGVTLRTAQGWVKLWLGLGIRMEMEMIWNV
jgi:hypothetical protein